MNIEIKKYVSRNISLIFIKRKTYLFLWILSPYVCLSFEANSKVHVGDLRCEYRINPLGIENESPRLSWKIYDSSFSRGQMQRAYQILVSSSEEKLAKGIGDVWNSGKVESSISVNNEYSGTALKSGQEYFWKVKIWDASQSESDWSIPAKFSIGLLNPEDWKGSWIYKSDQTKKDHNWYRKSFYLSDSPSTGLIYIGSYGYHELYVNGEKITENVLNPVLSYMPKRIPYLTYDISDKLVKGKNVIAIWHAAGWARWQRLAEYRNPPFALNVQAYLNVKGEKISISTDESWKCKKSLSEYYGDWDILHFGGETIDDRKKEDDWNTIDYDDADWDTVKLLVGAPKIDNKETLIVKEDIPVKRLSKSNEYEEITAELSSQIVEPQVKFKEIRPIGVTKNGDGSFTIDMGVNYTGFFEMNLFNGVSGDSVLFEISDQIGLKMNWNQKSKYIFGSDSKGIFTNRFNYAGGRWITIYGLKYQPELKDIKGFVISNDRKQISKFECSNDLLNRMYEINLDTYIANTLDGILMDCPHRERRGWGEVTVAAMYGDALPNFESGAYMHQYMQFMRDAQLPDGQIRAIINENDRPFLMWKANNPITVWETYRMLGDKKILEDNYVSMNKWMTWMFENSNYNSGGALITGKQGGREFPGLGDWCTPKGNFWTSANSPDANHFNNCIYAFMLDNAKRIAKELGKTEDMQTFAERLKVQREATHKLSYNPETGEYVSGQQVNQAFALLAGIAPEEEREKVYAALVDKILYSFPYYDTGSSGQGLYTRFFTEYGERMDLIYELLKDRHHPSYGYFIDQGETTWPERWSSVGVSKIHTCYTGIGGYFIKGFGGIRPGSSENGMKNILIKPALVGDLTFANTEYNSLYGNIVVNWKKVGDGAIFHIEIPVNTSAKIYLPAISKNEVFESGILAEKAEGVSFLGAEKSDAVGSYIIFDIESGIYEFKVENLPKTSFPSPKYKSENLSQIARMNASSMYIETEKLPGFEAFKANDENEETSWKAGSSNDQYLELEWLHPQLFNALEINELGENIESFKIQYWDGDKWLDILSDAKCGSHKTLQFQTVKGSKCRLYILKSKKPVSIAELKVFNKR